MNILQFNWT